MNNLQLYSQVPRVVVGPASGDEVADLIGRAASEQAAVVPWGAGTRQHIGCPPERYDLALCLDRLDQVLDYTPADLVVTVQAGVTLGALQDRLAHNGQWLPWDAPCCDRATIGGLLATGATGPLRLGYGTPRDWTLGLHVVLGDGRLVKSGAKVVKNVAGYDAHKLHLGALGTLGVIVAASFKLMPLPTGQCTMLVACSSLSTMFALMDALYAPPLSPVSLVALNGPAVRRIPILSPLLPALPEPYYVVIARFAGVPSGLDRQVQTGRQRSTVAGAHSVEVDTEQTLPIWRAIASLGQGLAEGDRAVLLRAGVRPAALPNLIQTLDMPTQRLNWPAAWLVYAGVGLVLCRWQLADTTEPQTVAAALVSLRAEVQSMQGYVVVEDAPHDLKNALDVWGPPPPTIRLMQALKQQWDPAGILNPGRYISV